MGRFAGIGEDEEWKYSLRRGDALETLAAQDAAVCAPPAGPLRVIRVVLCMSYKVRNLVVVLQLLAQEVGSLLLFNSDVCFEARRQRFLDFPKFHCSVKACGITAKKESTSATSDGCPALSQPL